MPRKEITMINEQDELKEALRIATEALEFYKDIGKNHSFIFDDVEASRAQVYERYSKTSIGDMGVKAYEALDRIKKLNE